MGSKQDTTKSEVIKVRVTSELRDRYKQARSSGAWASRAETDFLGYLVSLGVVRYEKAILPIERGEDIDVSVIEKKIPKTKAV